MGRNRNRKRPRKQSSDSKSSDDATKQGAKDKDDQSSKQNEKSATEVSELKRLNTEVLKRYKDLQDERDCLQSKNNELRKSIDTLSTENKKMQHTEDLLRQKYNEKQLSVEKLELDNSNKQCTIGTLNKDIESLQSRYRRLQQENASQRTEIEQLTKTKDELLGRISKIAGTKLTTGNPNITDLNDPYRPQKLGEMFSSLYDDQWSEAYEYLLDECGEEDETQCIKYLLDLFMKCSDFCADLAEKQIIKLQNDLVTPTLDDSTSGLVRDTVQFTELQVWKNFIDMRKTQLQVPDHISQLFQQCNSEVDKDSRIQSFIQTCIKLCWFAAIQDPPVVFLLDVKRDDDVDERYFRPYTQTGSVVDYLVWPAMLLHKDGSVLCRGVVQPFKTDHIKKLSN